MSDFSAFFYGTLMAPPVLHRVICGPYPPTELHKSLLKVKPAILHGYCRRRVKSADYPAIIPMQGATVRGSYVSGLTDADMWRLDIFEGDEYIRTKVKVSLLDTVGDPEGHGNIEGAKQEAETYVWTAPNGRLEQEEWDFAEFQSEKMHRWVESEVEYQEVDEITTGDPTGGRGFVKYEHTEEDRQAIKDSKTLNNAV